MAWAQTPDFQDAPSCIHQTLNTTASARPFTVLIAACTATAASTFGVDANATCTAMGKVVVGALGLDKYLSLVCPIN